MNEAGMSGEPQAPEGKALLKRFLAEPLVAQAIQRLQKELPSGLRFHTVEHTFDVIEEVIRFANEDGLPEHDLKLLVVAAAFHDTGFLKRPVDNEVVGASIARSTLEKHGGFTETDISTIEAMILDTRLVDAKGGPKQVPTIELSKYLLDADLSNLGRDDFFERNELLRQELGVEKSAFLAQSLRLVENHKWLTPAGDKLRRKGQEKNRKKLVKLIEELNASGAKPGSEMVDGMSIERLVFLGKLPLLLNSSLELQRIASIALDHLQSMLSAEAATLFLLEESTNELTFWSLQGSQAKLLAGERMPLGKGIIGWVINNKKAIRTDNPAEDKRFFGAIDQLSGFKTRNLVCAPLISRGTRIIGGVQVLNKKGGESFTDHDLLFVEQFSHQMSLALENAQLYEKLMEQNLKLATLERRKNEIISVISHEFRTPLNVVRASAELLGSGDLDDPASQQKMAETLDNGVERLTKLLAEIGKVTHVTGESFEITKEKFSIEDLFRRVADQFTEPASQRKIALETKIESGVTDAFADFALILIVMGNLVSNAIRFTPDGGKITVEAQRGAGLVEIKVRDTGIGIAADQIPVIFEKFYEVIDHMQHSSGEFEFKSGGLGLGLFTSQEILQEHGTKLEVESELGKGSTFTFRLEISA